MTDFSFPKNAESKNEGINIKLKNDTFCKVGSSVVPFVWHTMNGLIEKA